MRTRKMHVVPILVFILLAVSLSGIGCGRRESGGASIQIKGSDTMVNLGQAWAEAFMKKHPQVSVAVTGGGSGTGIASLIAGTCDIAELSREIKPDEIQLARQRGIDPRQVNVALDGLAVVVHPKNPVSRMTLDQLALVFSGTITNWKDLGGDDLPIVVLSREVNSGTHVYFKEHVLRRGDAGSQVEFAAGSLLLPSSQAIADEIAQNPGAIGYYGMGYLSPRQKTIAVARDASSPFVPPSRENVLDGAYPISRPLLMVTGKRGQKWVDSFMEFVLSAEGQQIVSQIDFVPIRK